jgi:hypothetical protein
MRGAAVSRRFYLERVRDVSGVSGIGVVAEGCEFSDGTVAMRWIANDNPRSTVIHESMDAVTAIHGHGGATYVVRID